MQQKYRNTFLIKQMCSYVIQMYAQFYKIYLHNFNTAILI